MLDHATLLSMMSHLRDTGSLAVAVIMGHETMNDGCRVQPGPKSEKLYGAQGALTPLLASNLFTNENKNISLSLMCYFFKRLLSH